MPVRAEITRCCFSGVVSRTPLVSSESVTRFNWLERAVRPTWFVEMTLMVSGPPPPSIEMEALGVCTNCATCSCRVCGSAPSAARPALSNRPLSPPTLNVSAPAPSLIETTSTPSNSMRPGNVVVPLRSCL